MPFFITRRRFLFLQKRYDDWSIKLITFHISVHFVKPCVNLRVQNHLKLFMFCLCFFHECCTALEYKDSLGVIWNHHHSGMKRVKGFKKKPYDKSVKSGWSFCHGLFMLRGRKPRYPWGLRWTAGCFFMQNRGRNPEIPGCECKRCDIDQILAFGSESHSDWNSWIRCLVTHADDHHPCLSSNAVMFPPRPIWNHKANP